MFGELSANYPEVFQSLAELFYHQAFPNLDNLKHFLDQYQTAFLLEKD
jgi:hypothetical protein